MQRFSSPNAHPVDPAAGAADQLMDLAAQLGTSERALRAARGMMTRHLDEAGKGQTGTLSATLEGRRHDRLSAPGLLAQGRAKEMRVGVALIADPLVVLVVGGATRALHWSLLPGGPSVTARADGLRFLRGLADGGQLTFEMAGGPRLPPLAFDGGPWDDEEEWRLFEDLAVLEEWSGMTIPMPEWVSAEDATTAAQAASWARAQQVDAFISDTIAFQVAGNGGGDGEPDELRLHQQFGVELLGAEVSLGEGTARVRVGRVERTGDTIGEYQAWLARPDVTFWLEPPSRPRVPARRTQASRVVPPTQPRQPSSRLSAAGGRQARRRLSAVLTTHRPLEASPSGTPTGTRALIDEIRGD